MADPCAASITVPWITICWTGSSMLCGLLRRHYVRPVDNDALLRGAVEGMLWTLDPYSEYIEPVDVETFEKQTTGSYEGIGAGIGYRDGELTVIGAFDQSPAQQAGLSGGEVIVAVDGHDTTGWSVPQVIKALTGPADTDLTVTGARRTDDRQSDVVITRRVIHVPTVTGWRRGDDPNAAGWEVMIDAEQRIALSADRAVYRSDGT